MAKQSLLLQTCYYDCFQYFSYVAKNKDALTWDYVCITASNEAQAFRYEQEINRRKASLPSQTKFVVIPDYNDQRIGSGGATLSVLKVLKEECGCSFDEHRILIIHSGGDAKRTPQYSALGKLFAPVPHLLSDGQPSTLFDELLISVSYLPTRINNGAFLLSGDVLLVFNNLDFNAPNEGAAVISFKENINIGQNHGVFKGANNKPVSKFLHKQPVDVLETIADSKGEINIDTGAVYFSSDLLNSLYSLVDTDTKFNGLVNETVRLSLYGDFLYPLCEESTLVDFYKEKPEGTYCEELEKARTLVWNTIRPYRVILESFSISKFIHFGTSKEVHDINTIRLADFAYFNWTNDTHSSRGYNDVSSYMSVIADGANIGENVYSELSYIHSNAVIGDNAIISHVDIVNNNIPSNVVVHGLKLNNGNFVVRLFGLEDNPKENKLFGININEKLKEFGFNLKPDSLWDAEIYPECHTIKEALNQSLNLYNLFTDSGDIDLWKKSKKQSLHSSFLEADINAIFDWRNKIDEIIKMERLYESIKALKPATSVERLFMKQELTKNQLEWLEEKQETVPFIDLAKIYVSLSTILNDDRYLGKAFSVINESIIKSYDPLIQFNPNLKIDKEDVLVQLPLRINFGGGWSDTPPYCNEFGGTVLNTAITLNGELPVSVSIKKIEENKIILKSDDMSAYNEFTDIEKLQDIGNPFDKFALQKAVLIACGVIPRTGGNLSNILNNIGGGFIIQSEVTNVPKGSGLGTSSILSACCVKAVYEFFGKEIDEHTISSVVICVEQLMSTGGGWQDQIGGLYKGVKLITSKPGTIQEPKVETISLSDKTINELNQRLVLISTGQRRLARNLLRSVISRYLSNNKDSLFALKSIKDLALQMKEALEKGNVTLFGQLLDEHWELSKMIDSGSTNDLIEQIFKSVDDLICGKMVVGAGGGGFLQVILKEGVSREMIRERILKEFKDTNIAVYDSALHI